ncbi:hypothetical protein BDV93DRAFT_528014 [Ceratobasidium sp. AG-I]|nr:hypothetical protein BDV93DRAFT_528014 [Ceratobasidium sp. AG-I]
MYDAAIRACLLQGEILTGSLLFVLLVRDWQNRHRHIEAPPEPDPPPGSTQTPSPLARWGRTFSHLSMSPIPSGAPTPPFPSPHILEAIVASLDLRPRLHPQVSHNLPPGRPPDSILALAHFAQLFAEGALPFSRVAALLKAIASVPPGPDHEFFQGIIKHVMKLPPEIDTRSYNVLINHALTVLRQPTYAQHLVDHMSNIRKPPLRIPDSTRSIIARGEVRLRRPGLAAEILSHIDERGHSTKLPTNPNPPALTLPNVNSKPLPLPRDTHLLATHIHNLTSTGHPSRVKAIIYSLIPELDLPPPPSRASFVSATKRAVSLGPSILTSLLNALCKAGKTGLAERVWRLGCAAQEHGTLIPLAFHTTMLQLYSREARKGLVTVGPEVIPERLMPPHVARAIMDVSAVIDPAPVSATAYGWGFATPLPSIPGLSPESVGRVDSRVRRWLLARHAAAEVYIRHIRPRLPVAAATPQSPLPPGSAQQSYTPDARLWNALFDTFGRRANMLLRTYQVNKHRHRTARARTYMKGPKQVDAFIRIIVQDMCQSGMAKDVPTGWRHFVEGEYKALLLPLPPTLNPRQPLSVKDVRKVTRGRERRGHNAMGRWRIRETRLRFRFGKRNNRAQLWAQKPARASWDEAVETARSRLVLARTRKRKWWEAKRIRKQKRVKLRKARGGAQGFRASYIDE